MPNTDLHGPHKLNSRTVSLVVTGVGPGAYALGRANADGLLESIGYVGRSDSDLAARLQQHAAEGAYPDFKYGFLKTPRAAFEKECHLYHDFTPSGNKVHPARANNAWTCPRCAVFG
jgi:hypothetical protein